MAKVKANNVAKKNNPDGKIKPATLKVADGDLKKLAQRWYKGEKMAALAAPLGASWQQLAGLLIAKGFAGENKPGAEKPKAKVKAAPVVEPKADPEPKVKGAKGKKSPKAEPVVLVGGPNKKRRAKKAA